MNANTFQGVAFDDRVRVWSRAQVHLYGAAGDFNSYRLPRGPQFDGNGSLGGRSVDKLNFSGSTIQCAMNASSSGVSASSGAAHWPKSRTAGSSSRPHFVS